MPKPGPPRGRVPRRAGVVRGCPAGSVVRGADGSAPPAVLPLPELGKLLALGTSWEDPRVDD